MRQANGCPLPPGVKFFIWPRYVLSVDGIEVRLSRYRAEIVLFLMSRPGRLFSALEVARAIYWDRADGGGDSPMKTLPAQVFFLLRDCRAAGVDLHLKKPGAFHGYAFMGVGLTERGVRKLENRTAAKARSETAADMAMRVSQRIAQDGDAGKPPGRPRKPKGGQAIIRHPDTVGDSGGWMFPANYERQCHRESRKDGADPIKPLAEHSPSDLGTYRLGRHK